MPRFIGLWALFLSAVLALSSCAYVRELSIKETKKKTNYDSSDFDVAIFFFGCSLENGSCQGRLALAFSSENMSYEKLVFDTVSIEFGDTTHSFVEGDSLVVSLGLRDNRKYVHHPFGRVRLSGSTKADLKLRGRVTFSDTSFRAISADIEYNVKRESGPVWLE